MNRGRVLYPPARADVTCHHRRDSGSIATSRPGPVPEPGLFVCWSHHERSAPQQVRINLELTINEPLGPLDDEIKNVVSYEDIVLSVKEVLVRGHINLVETLAELIVDLCFVDERVEGVCVRIEKIDAIPEAESVGVKIERFRSEY